MRSRTLTLVSISLIAIAAGTSAGNAATTKRGARFTISNSQSSAVLYAEESADPLTGASSTSASLKLTIGTDTQTFDCTWSMPDDPVVLGAATLHAECAPYKVAASFTVVGGGTGTFPLVCSATFDRPAQAGVIISRDGTNVVTGSAQVARVWRALDLGTCH